MFDIKDFNIKYKKDVKVEDDKYVKEEILKNGFLYIVSHIYPLEKKDKKKFVSFLIRGSIYFYYMFVNLIEQKKDTFNVSIKNNQIVVSNGGLFGWFIWFYLFKHKMYSNLFKNLKTFKKFKKIDNNEYVSINNIKFKLEDMFEDFDEYDNYLNLKDNKIDKIASKKEILAMLFLLNFMKKILEEKKFYQDEYEYFVKRIKELFELVKNDLKSSMNYTIYYNINKSFKEIKTNIDSDEIEKVLTLILDLFDYVLNLKGRVVLKKINKNTIGKLTLRLIKQKKLDFEVINNDAKKIRDYLDNIKEWD